MGLSKKIVYLLIITLSTIFISIGYAALTDNFWIEGQVSVTPKPYQGVYIYNAKVILNNNVKDASFDYTKPTNFKNKLTPNQNGATITYEITVHNNTDMTYWYLGTKYLEDYGSNSLIGATNGVFITTKDTNELNSTLFDTSDWVPAQTFRTFYVTYRFGSNVQKQIEMLINFEFGLHMESVQDEFLKILNDKVSDNGYKYLEKAFSDKYKENGSQTIANIGDETELFDTMLGRNLTVNIDGEEKPVTIMINRKDVDGDENSGDSYVGNGAPSGCEYTIYLTVEDLKNPGGQVTVYAVSYTCGPDGMFYQIGELYEGHCTVEDYDKTDTVYNGAFNLDGWKATAKEYSVTDLITYKVGYEQGTNFDKMNTIEELMSATDQEFYNKVNNNTSNLLKPVCNVIYSYRHNNGQWIESDNEANKYKPGYDLLKQAFDNIKPYCYIGNGAQEVKIQNANSLSRAELIPMLEAIQNAYDYYLEVNPE